MKKISLAEVRLDMSRLPEVIAEVERHQGDNPGCALSSIWRDANAKGLHYLHHHGFASLDWVGMGWPTKREVYANADPMGIAECFEETDCLDINSALHEVYQITDRVRYPRRVLDLGGGYGRIGLALMSFSPRIAYDLVDYSPMSLFAAPQVLNQFFPDGQWTVRGAWGIEGVADQSCDVVVNINSMQEMQFDQYDYYMRQVRRVLRIGGLFYFNNHASDYGVDYSISGYLRVQETMFHERLGARQIEVFGIKEEA